MDIGRSQLADLKPPRPLDASRYDTVGVGRRRLRPTSRRASFNPNQVLVVGIVLQRCANAGP
jgi:hypothetical protein